VTAQQGFLRPELLVLLLAAPVLLLLLVAGDLARRRALVAFAGQGASFVARSTARGRVKSALAVIALLVASLAAAGPYVDVREREVKHLGVDLVIAVDISQSMAVRDVAATDRLGLARDAVQTLGARLTGSRIALALFANEGVVRYPATTDPELLGRVLDNSARGFRLPAGSSLRAGLAAALDGFPDAIRESPANKAVVVISDGEYSAEDVPDLAPYSGRNIRIFALGVGTVEGGQIPTYDTEGRPTGSLRGPGGQPVISRLNEVTLRAVADGTGGRYWRHTASDGSVPELVRELRALDTSEVSADGGSVPDDRYQIALAIALALLMLAWLMDDRAPMPVPKGARPDSRAPRVRRLPWSRRPAMLTLAALVALSCTDAMAEQNQAANTLYARGDFRGALARYRDLQQAKPELAQLSVNAGNALQRLQEHARALSDYGVGARSEDTTLRLHAHYGRGSALFRQGKLDEARDAFKDALRADPTDRDAKFNIEVIDRLQAALRSNDQGQPGQGPQQPGQGPQQPGQQPGQQPSQQPGRAPGGAPPPPGAQPGGTPGETLDRAVLEFRQNLTEADALKLLDALARDQGGIEGLLEGQPSGGNRQAPY